MSSVSEEAQMTGTGMFLGMSRLLAPPIHPRVPRDGYALPARLTIGAGRGLVIRSA